MPRFRHKFRQSLSPDEPIFPEEKSKREDLVFFLVSFTSAFIIIYSFVF